MYNPFVVLGGHKPSPARTDYICITNTAQIHRPNDERRKAPLPEPATRRGWQHLLHLVSCINYLKESLQQFERCLVIFHLHARLLPRPTYLGTRSAVVLLVHSSNWPPDRVFTLTIRLDKDVPSSNDHYRAGRVNNNGAVKSGLWPPYFVILMRTGVYSAEDASASPGDANRISSRPHMVCKLRIRCTKDGGGRKRRVL